MSPVKASPPRPGWPMAPRSPSASARSVALGAGPLARVEVIEPTGHETYLKVLIGGQTVTLLTGDRPTLKVGGRSRCR